MSKIIFIFILISSFTDLAFAKKMARNPNALGHFCGTVAKVGFQNKSFFMNFDRLFAERQIYFIKAQRAEVAQALAQMGYAAVNSQTASKYFCFDPNTFSRLSENTYEAKDDSYFYLSTYNALDQ